MSGLYGWNIEAIQDLITSESEFTNTTEPVQNQEDVSSENSGSSSGSNTDQNSDLSSELPSIKGYYWCVSNGEIPSQAIKSGIDKDGGDLYVGRAIYEGEMQPAKIVPNHGCAYIAYNGEEIQVTEYEILCKGNCTVIWQECGHGRVPDHAVGGGYTADNEKLYIGRVFHDGTQTPGKIQPSRYACLVPYGGEVLSFTEYEVLILQH